MKNKLLYCLIVIFLFNACKYNAADNQKDVTDTATFSEAEQLVMTVVWFQKSAEMQACYWQAYNLAKLALDKNLADYKGDKKKAVIVDVDETILDNSPYQAKLIEMQQTYALDTWKQWTNLAKAKALPGAVEFLNYAKSKNVEVFYISNRDADEVNKTMENLINEGLPFADEQHLLFREQKNSDKTIRRSKVDEQYEILLLVGDNLRDFDEIFADRQQNLGIDIVTENKDKFGTKYIMLPNPMYGEWEKAIYGGKYPDTKEDIIKLRKKILDANY